jgi:enamine deaminase RidA (YjgF/YER057c/UK114 family)
MTASIVPRKKHMTDRELIVPPTMQRIVERAGYVPAVKVGTTVFCAGQVGRSVELEVIADPEAQFLACWENLRVVLQAAGCTFEDVVDMTTYHVQMSTHMPVFRAVKNRVFPRGTCAWTTIGVSELAHPGLLVEIKCVAVKRDSSAT